MKPLDKLSVHDETVEQAVLGCIISYPRVAGKIYKLDIDDFYSIKHQTLFKALQKIMNDTGQLDRALLPTGFLSDKFYDGIFFTEYYERHFDGYLKKLKDTKVKRDMQGLAYEIEIKIEEDRPVSDIKNYISKTTDDFTIVDDFENSQEAQNKSIRETFFDTMVEKNITYVESGFPGIDDLIGGFIPSTYTIVVGLPKAGKTFFLINMANSCMEKGLKVLYVTLEMSYELLQARLISLITGIRTSLITSSREILSDSQKDKIKEAYSIVDKTYKFRRIGVKEVNPAAIENEFKSLGGFDIIFIDYLQLVEKSKNASRYESVSQNSRDIKRLANTLKVPIVCVASINRESIKRVNKRPQLSDLRDSGNIEYDCDFAIILHRDCLIKEWESEMKDGDERDFKNKAEAIIAKNRFGVDDYSVKLKFEPEFARFTSVDKGLSQEVKNDYKEYQEEIWNQ